MLITYQKTSQLKNRSHRSQGFLTSDYAQIAPSPSTDGTYFHYLIALPLARPLKFFEFFAMLYQDADSFILVFQNPTATVFCTFSSTWQLGAVSP